jgi:outer membrane protein OmpA-like peptidoglycan-associated protein
VATALTNVFAVPPENMETQGYGEQYLKVETQEPEREQARRDPPHHAAGRARCSRSAG